MVRGLGCGGWSLGFGVQGAGLRVGGVRFGIEGGYFSFLFFIFVFRYMAWGQTLHPLWRPVHISGTTHACLEVPGSWFRVECAGLRVWGFGFGVWGLRLGVRGSGLGLQGPESRDLDLGVRI